MNFLQILEEKHFARLAPQQVLKFAQQSSDFSKQWLIHALHSNVTLHELAVAIAFSDKWQLPSLTKLEQYLAELFTGQEIGSLPFEQEIAQVKLLLEDFSEPRIVKLLNQLTALPKLPNMVETINVSTKVENIHAPQSLIDTLITIAKPHLRDVTLFGDEGSESENRTIRNNTHFPVPLPNGLLELALLEKLMACSAGMSLQFAEPSVILRYQPNQYYKWHYDHIYAHNQSIQQQIDQFGQRKKTAIFYLNDNFTGGETEFKNPFSSVKAKKGNILSFDNCDENELRLTNSLHRGAEVTSGEKWIINLWFRSKPFWLRNGLL